MAVGFYNGYAYDLEAGGRVTHETALGGVTLAVEVPGDPEVAAVLLSNDEAMQLAMTLLRDVSLNKFGVG